MFMGCSSIPSHVAVTEHALVLSMLACLLLIYKTHGFDENISGISICLQFPSQTVFLFLNLYLLEMSFLPLYHLEGA